MGQGRCLGGGAAQVPVAEAKLMNELFTGRAGGHVGALLLRRLYLHVNQSCVGMGY